jgi:nucleotide-binding universal stress UspA family protein
MRSKEDDRMYERILVPLDGSEFAETSLPHVEIIAKGCNAKKVILFGVVETSAPWQSSVVRGMLGENFIKEAVEKSRKWLTDYLNKTAETLRGKGLIVTAVIEKGNPAERILEYSTKGIDLIVISTHGRSGLGKFAFGSVAEKVLQNSRVPIIVVTGKSG